MHNLRFLEHFKVIGTLFSHSAFQSDWYFFYHLQIPEALNSQLFADYSRLCPGCWIFPTTGTSPRSCVCTPSMPASPLPFSHLTNFSQSPPISQSIPRFYLLFSFPIQISFLQVLFYLFFSPAYSLKIPYLFSPFFFCLWARQLPPASYLEPTEAIKSCSWEEQSAYVQLRSPNPTQPAAVHGCSHRKIPVQKLAQLEHAQYRQTAWGIHLLPLLSSLQNLRSPIQRHQAIFHKD